MITYSLIKTFKEEDTIICNENFFRLFTLLPITVIFDIFFIFFQPIFLYIYRTLGSDKE